MAGAIFFILRILGTVLLAVLVLVLIILLIVLFVPVRYSFGGEVRDPEGSTEPLHLDPAKDVSLGGEVSWLMGLVRGKASYEGAFQIEIRVFGRRLDVQKLLKKKAKRQEKEPSGEKKAPETFEEKLERILTRIETIHARLEDTCYGDQMRSPCQREDGFLCAPSSGRDPAFTMEFDGRSWTRRSRKERRSPVYTGILVSDHSRACHNRYRLRAVPI